MKTIFQFTAILAILLITLSNRGDAQFVEDALRLSAPNVQVGARSLGLGSVLTGTADDFSATFTNPAGLGLIRMNEFSFGFSNLSVGNTNTFLNQQQSLSTSATNLNSAGLVYTVPTTRGSLVFALGYGRQADFSTGLSFSGFNAKSSIIQAYAPDDSIVANPAGNLAWELFLANADSLGPNRYRWDSKIFDAVTQTGKVLEGGGLNNYSAAAGIEAAQNVFLGLTLNFISGLYSYSRNYYEDDFRNIYDSSRYPFDFKSFSLTEKLETDISGFSAKFGFLYVIQPKTKIGLTIKTPSWMTVRETFSSSGRSEFDNGDVYTFPSGTINPSRNEYDVRTPFIFSAGISHAMQDITMSADVEYTDWTQIEFKSGTAAVTDFSRYLLDLNADIKTIFHPTANIRVGAEYEMKDAGVQLRGGFAYLPSPYQSDAAANAQKYITGGVGFKIENAFGIDLGYSHGFWETSHVNYNAYDVNGNALSETKEMIKMNTLVGTLTYRF